MDLLAEQRFEAPDRSFVGHRDIQTRSAARYLFVAPHLRGSVLDIGCGRGYGLEIVEGKGLTAVGVDVSLQFLRAARARLATAPLVNASGDGLPFASGSFDSIISFDVIEHIDDDQRFLDEVRRTTRQGAFIAVSSPNRLAASGRRRIPLNRFHVREYASDEFYSLLSGTFSSVTMFGQSEKAAGDSTRTTLSRLIDRIPIRWKYLLPAHTQDILSVAIRPPLTLQEVRFDRERLEIAHTFIALCQR
jgi:SAM-dependent methyltransferase